MKKLAITQLMLVVAGLMLGSGIHAARNTSDEGVHHNSKYRSDEESSDKHDEGCGCRRCRSCFSCCSSKKRSTHRHDHDHDHHHRCGCHSCRH